MIDKLIKVCEKHVIPASALTVVSEPYIPFIPAKWNGVLVLAESQDLSDKNDSYVVWLKSLPAIDRIKRLYLRDTLGIIPWDDGTLKLAVESLNYNTSETASDRIKRLYLRDALGVQPWDDGSMKLAMECLNFNVSDTAVCNAVLWSQVRQNERNDNTDGNLKALSANLWSKLLPVMNPTLVICCGKIAKDVIAATELSGKILSLPQPSSSTMSRTISRHNEEDLLSRYPEVNAAVTKHPDLIGSTHHLKKILFACNAVRLTRAFKVKERMVKESIIGRGGELVICLHCGILLRNDRLNVHISMKHARHTKSSALEDQWVEKKCKQCAAVIFVKPEWKCSNVRCLKCYRERQASSKKVDKTSRNKRIELNERIKLNKRIKLDQRINENLLSAESKLRYAQVSYAHLSLRGWPMQGGSPGLGKKR